MKILIKTGVLKLSFYFLQKNEMSCLNIYMMKFIILSFLLEPNATGDKHQTSVESTQFEHIQATFTTFDSLCYNCLYPATINKHMGESK